MISGLGGVGKSQTAIKYAHRYAKPNDSYEQRYDWAFWIKADTDLNLESDFAEIARQVGIAQTGQTNPELAQAAKGWLERTSDRWLLIFDNANTPSLLKPYRCQNPQGRTLLTSRTNSFASLGIRQPLALEVLSEAEAVTFLWERTEQVRPDRQTTEAQAAIELAKELGYLPLALEQAAAYIAFNEDDFEHYLMMYHQQKLQLLEEPSDRMGDYPESVATTWKINFNDVSKKSPAAADVLRLSAFLAPDEIPYELLVQGAANLGEAIASALSDIQSNPLVLNKVLTPLAEYSLIRRDREAKCYSLHRLVQLVQRHEMSTEEKTVWCDRAVASLNDIFPNPEFENWKYCERLISHIAAVWVHQPPDSLSWARVLHQASHYLNYRGRFETAIVYSERSLQMWETQLGGDHPNIGAGLCNLASLYELMGQYSEVEPLCQRALQIFETQLGSNHFYTTVGMGRLAQFYKVMGRYSEAEPLFVRSLQIRETQLGNNHLHTACSMIGLAGFCQSIGRYSEAESLFAQAIEIQSTQLGYGHPHIITSFHNLALLYKAMGRYSEAETLFVNILQIRKTQLGSEHPDTVTTLHNLALLYGEMGRYSEAESLFRQTLQIRETQFGSDHPDTASSLGGLALLYELIDLFRNKKNGQVELPKLGF
ncbi:MAG: tetratricopeptide repeat protein [Leptolyngbyaceae cyanobacterium SM1_4_3]|nr:tetratricopeptide repeat protein [Leptolyngbyaceae cyanobacterium SM1_4_3]